MGNGSDLVLSSNQVNRTKDTQDEPDGEEQTRGHRRLQRFFFIWVHNNVFVSILLKPLCACIASLNIVLSKKKKIVLFFFSFLNSRYIIFLDL